MTDAASSTAGITKTSVATPSRERSPSVTSASTGAFRATISWTLLTILSLVALTVQMATTGNCSSRSAIGPCLSRPPEVPSAWTRDLLQLERALERDGVAQSAAGVYEVAVPAVPVGQGEDLLLPFQERADLLR